MRRCFANDRIFFERRFGRDFGQVRIVVDDGATNSVGANAFAIGRQIVFGAEHYAPTTIDGRRLLAHELAHVVQQSSEGPASPSEALEAEARTAADSVSVGRNVAVAGNASPGALQMQEAAHGHVEVIAKENGRIAVVLIRGGKIVKGYAELTPPPGKSAAESAELVRTRVTGSGAIPNVEVILPPDWGKPSTNPAAPVRIVDAETDKKESERTAIIDALRNQYRAYLSDYAYHDEAFLSVFNPSMADRATEQELLGLLANADFFKWRQGRQRAQDYQQFAREAQAMGYSDPRDIRELWANYARPTVETNEAVGQAKHELQYDTFNALKRDYAAPLLLEWIAKNPAAVEGSGGVKQYEFDLPQGGKATLSEAQFKDLRAEALRQIETRLNTVRNSKDFYSSYKNDRGLAVRAGDAIAGAELKGDSWSAIDKSQTGARLALKKGDIKTTLKYLDQSEKQRKVAVREWNRYEANRELAGEVTITGIKVTAAALTVYAAAPTLATLGTGAVTLKTVGAGAALGGAFSAGRIGAQVYDKSRKLPDWKEITLEIGEGAVTGAGLAFVPEAGALLAAPGGAGMVDEFAQGHYATGAFDAATLFGPYAAEKAPKVLSWARPRIAAGTLAVHTALELPGLSGRPSGALPFRETPTLSAESVASPRPADPAGLESPGRGATQGINEQSQGHAELSPGDEIEANEQGRDKATGEDGRRAQVVPERASAATVDERAKPGDPTEPKAQGSADLGPDDASASATPKYRAKSPAAGAKTGANANARAALSNAARREGGVYDQLTNGDVVSNLDARGAVKVYAACKAEQPGLEAAILQDADTGEFFVVQGGVDADGRPEVNLEQVLFSEPEFAARNLKFRRHYHPGQEIINRVPSAEDFATLLRSFRLRLGPREALTSVLDYYDPVTGKLAQSTFKYTPGAEKPYSIRYRATDQSWQSREFVNPPDLPGSDYERFLHDFTGGPADRAPEPVAADELRGGSGSAIPLAKDGAQGPVELGSPVGAASPKTPVPPGAAPPPPAGPPPAPPAPTTATTPPQFLTPSDIAKLSAFGPDEYEVSLRALLEIIKKTKGFTEKASLREYVETRQAAGELRTIMDALRDPSKQAVKIVPGNMGGRSPDLYVRDAAGGEHRIEVVNVTSASRDVRPELGKDPLGREVPKITRKDNPDPGKAPVVDLPTNDFKMAEIRDAIRAKIKTKAARPNQLDALNANTLIGGRQMNVGGDVVVQISHGEVTKTELDQIIDKLTPELMASSVQKVLISGVDDAQPGAGRKIFEYVRSGSTFAGTPRAPFYKSSSVVPSAPGPVPTAGASSPPVAPPGTTPTPTTAP